MELWKELTTEDVEKIHDLQKNKNSDVIYALVVTGYTGYTGNSNSISTTLLAIPNLNECVFNYRILKRDNLDINELPLLITKEAYDKYINDIQNNPYIYEYN